MWTEGRICSFDPVVFHSFKFAPLWVLWLFSSKDRWPHLETRPSMGRFTVRCSRNMIHHASIDCGVMTLHLFTRIMEFVLQGNCLVHAMSQRRKKKQPEDKLLLEILLVPHHEVVVIHLLRTRHLSIYKLDCHEIFYWHSRSHRWFILPLEFIGGSSSMWMKLTFRFLNTFCISALWSAQSLIFSSDLASEIWLPTQLTPWARFTNKLLKHKMGFTVKKNEAEKAELHT